MKQFQKTTHSGGIEYRWLRHLKNPSEQEIYESLEISGTGVYLDVNESERRHMALAFAFLQGVHIAEKYGKIELPKMCLIDPKSKLGISCRLAIAKLLEWDSPPGFLLQSLASMVKPGNPRALPILLTL